MRLQLIFLFFLGCILLGSCTKKDLGGQRSAALKSPEDVVKEFIQLSAHSKTVEDRKVLQDLCAGEMKRAFERMSEEEFRMTYINQEVQLKEMKVLENAVQNDIATIHYQVAIQNVSGTDSTHEMNEREVQLKFSQGAWYIESIRMRGSDKLAFTRGMIF